MDELLLLLLDLLLTEIKRIFPAVENARHINFPVLLHLFLLVQHEYQLTLFNMFLCFSVKLNQHGKQYLFKEEKVKPFSSHTFSFCFGFLPHMCFLFVSSRNTVAKCERKYPARNKLNFVFDF